MLFEVPDLLHGEAARDDDLDVLKTTGIQRAPHVPHQLRIHAGGLERPHLRNDRLVDQRLGRVESDAVQPVAESARDGERGPHAIVVEIHQGDEPNGGVGLVGELA